VIGAGVAVAEDADVAGLTDGEGILEQEGNAADGGIAGGDVVDGAGERAVEDGQHGLRLHGPTVVSTAVVAWCGDGKSGRWTDNVSISHRCESFQLD
jgi:hypothetical protein